MKTEPGIIAHGDEINGQQVIIAKPTKMNFEELKKEILKRAKDNDACKSGYGQALGSTDHKTLLQAIKDNIAWWVNHKVVDADFLDLHFGIEMLNELNIYTSGKHNLSFNKNIYLVLLGSSSANVETWDSSSANVETWDSSSANVKTWGSSSKLTHSLGNGAGNLIKHMNERKIYVRKSDFEIVEI